MFNKNTEEYNVKTSENDVKHSNFHMGEMDKSRELYSKEGDNSRQIEGKTVPWEHTIVVDSRISMSFNIIQTLSTAEIGNCCVLASSQLSPKFWGFLG